MLCSSYVDLGISVRLYDTSAVLTEAVIHLLPLQMGVGRSIKKSSSVFGGADFIFSALIAAPSRFLAQQQLSLDLWCNASRFFAGLERHN